MIYGRFAIKTATVCSTSREPIYLHVDNAAIWLSWSSLITVFIHVRRRRSRMMTTTTTSPCECRNYSALSVAQVSNLPGPDETEADERGRKEQRVRLSPSTAHALSCLSVWSILDADLRRGEHTHHFRPTNILRPRNIFATTRGVTPFRIPLVTITIKSNIMEIWG